MSEDNMGDPMDPIELTDIVFNQPVEVPLSYKFETDSDNDEGLVTTRCVAVASNGQKIIGEVFSTVLNYDADLARAEAYDRFKAAYFKYLA